MLNSMGDISDKYYQSERRFLADRYSDSIIKARCTSQFMPIEIEKCGDDNCSWNEDD